MILQALEPLQPHWPHLPLQPHWPQQPLQPNFIKALLDSDGFDHPWHQNDQYWFFCGMDHQKSNLLLIADTLSVGGC